MSAPAFPPIGSGASFDLYVRGEIPSPLLGCFVVACSRRNKDRAVFSRWQDSQADILRLDLYPGRPGRIHVRILPVDPSGADLGARFCRNAFERQAYGTNPAYGYATQPNHGLNIAGGTLWATNLLFGAPLEIDLATFTPLRILRYHEPDARSPRVTTTSHFAWSLDGRHAYFHQSRLAMEDCATPVCAQDLMLIEMDVHTGVERTWRLLPPPEDSAPEGANFHSAFYFEEDGRHFVGLLRTGAIIRSLAPHADPTEHGVTPMQPSTIWLVEVDHQKKSLQAEILPGIRELGGFALSHLDVDATGGNGFVLYANFKQAAVGEETHGENVYGEPALEVMEHYSGMIVEALNYGMVMRYERRDGKAAITTFSQAYDPGRTSRGHSWLPINIELGATKKHLFCTFSGFHPRLLPRHIAAAYPEHVVDANDIRYVPPLLMRFDAQTLQPDYDGSRTYMSMAEPIASAVVGDGTEEYVCTFSPEIGLRIYRADNLNHMVCHASSANLMHWEDSHFRPDPAHMQFVPGR